MKFGEGKEEGKETGRKSGEEGNMMDRMLKNFTYPVS